MEWKPIETAPQDGSEVWVKRVYQGRCIREGYAVWGVNSQDSPMRQGEDADIAYADTPRWLTPDRRFTFPTPTHWSANKE
jgi:hypothetical protein